MKKLTKDIEIKKLDLNNEKEVAYCRNGYGKHVISEFQYDLSHISLDIIPAGFVALNKNKDPIGRVVIGFETDSNFWVEKAGGKNSPWIYAVFVEEEYRGLGIGKSLILQVIKYLKKHNQVSLCLDTNTAGQWYQKEFNFIKSHQGFYLGDEFDIYYLLF